MADVSPFPLISDLTFPDRVPVKHKDGEVLYWVNAEGARQLWQKGLAKLRSTNKKVRAVEVIERKEKPKAGVVVAMTGEALHAPGYSHNHEVSETYLGEDGAVKRRHPLDANAEKVWTLKRIDPTTRDLFYISVHDCLTKAA